MKINKKNLIWIDLEMTGLNPKVHRIIEIATLITDTNLNIIAEGPVIPIYQKKEHILVMDEWNKRIHENNGLIKRVEKSLYNEQKAEHETILFLKKWVPIQVSPMCGNSIAQDRRFLFQYMPHLENYFHYRYIDVSTIKELAYRWNPSILDKFKKNHHHKALEDIRESVVELNFYKKNFLKFKKK
ncbi:oligoribonuclease [Buchnera aphidicola]|uniref:Oligoribonuclease n=1 Tax=Buchnera aphidicola subsp. Acyrthosiphon pisum (strain 5A) TaxID=563178 RepID=A0A7U3YAL4_BUCA5|nr:oligoribonuclease [Buchnera aphidicola]OQX98358.1 MAG: oligoribonuclease [Erwiniaceae bacterium 4572_131]ACL30360.1 oligoribonuclease [Buchnera aphidicola str. Tuc7 (Acyrthosiphon pisum)]ACL30914.1 oligoribonuclease [Buchnera aphidicola str. 5A (Acyrthosiphon pisum)]ADP66376.1 oligoribonuclease [Buchnera aphidicola str. LL01 (Acyrthosiphon pisum)]ADP67538.1 oligoribonuclease [Buchnera aphidicola str. JF99 (Acyrthosiphon pisum)]